MECCDCANGLHIFMIGCGRQAMGVTYKRLSGGAVLPEIGRRGLAPRRLGPGRVDEAGALPASGCILFDATRLSTT